MRIKSRDPRCRSRLELDLPVHGRARRLEHTAAAKAAQPPPPPMPPSRRPRRQTARRRPARVVALKVNVLTSPIEREERHRSDADITAIG